MRSQLEGAILDYTHRVVNDEWPKMADMRYQPSKQGAHLLWSTVMSYHTTDPREQMLIDKSIDQLSAISQSRSQRFVFYEDDLPSVVWFVIYLGCVITIGFSYFFGSHVFRAQIIMCAFFSIMLGVTILAILELAHPYQGVVVISDEPFRYAIARMEETGHYKMATASAAPVSKAP